jgi:hypothetical protein
MPCKRIVYAKEKKINPTQKWNQDMNSLSPEYEGVLTIIFQLLVEESLHFSNHYAAGIE